MLKQLTSLNAARVLVVIGFIAGLRSLSSTISHIGDDRFRLIANPPGAPPLADTHSWLHYFREVGGDIAIMIAILLLLFSAPRFRNSTGWWVMLTLAIGYYAPSLVGILFMPELAPPNVTAGLSRLAQTIPTVIGILIARKHFVQGQFVSRPA